MCKTLRSDVSSQCQSHTICGEGHAWRIGIVMDVILHCKGYLADVTLGVATDMQSSAGTITSKVTAVA
eukprot:4902653-Amphidinium_carterae.1